MVISIYGQLSVTITKTQRYNECMVYHYYHIYMIITIQYATIIRHVSLKYHIIIITKYTTELRQLYIIVL